MRSKKVTKDKGMIIKRILLYLMGAITFIIPIKLYYTTPTDFDAGPMMAYNFLFFYPLTILTIVLSFIVIYKIKGLGKQTFAKAIMLISIMPTILLTSIVVLHILRITNEPRNYNIEKLNNEVSVRINDTLIMELNMFTNIVLNEKGEYIDKKIVNVLAYSEDKYLYKEGLKFTSLTKDQSIVYGVLRDSLILYVQNYDFSYFIEDRQGLPLKIHYTMDDKLPIKILENQMFKTLIWK